MPLSVTQHGLLKLLNKNPHGLLLASPYGVSLRHGSPWAISSSPMVT
jgi:hypothetical protein